MLREARVGVERVWTGIHAATAFRCSWRSVGLIVTISDLIWSGGKSPRVKQRPAWRRRQEAPEARLNCSQSNFAKI
jgi:hypothetical protein